MFYNHLCFFCEYMFMSFLHSYIARMSILLSPQKLFNLSLSFDQVVHLQSI